MIVPCFPPQRRRCVLCRLGNRGTAVSTGRAASHVDASSHGYEFHGAHFITISLGVGFDDSLVGIGVMQADFEKELFRKSSHGPRPVEHGAWHIVGTKYNFHDSLVSDSSLVCAAAFGGSTAEVCVMERAMSVYRAGEDVFIYVVGSVDENELILVKVLDCLVESLRELLKCVNPKARFADWTARVHTTFDKP